MASPVKEAKLKAQQIWSGATVHARGKGSIKHQHPTEPNRFMIDTQVGNRGWHFGDGPFTEANEVDTAWIDADPILDEPWQKKMVLADYNAYAFREATLGFDKGQLIEYVHPASGEAVNFQPQELEWTNDNNDLAQISAPQAVAANVDDDILTWAGAYGAGIDFQWQTQTARLMKYVNIASLADLGSPPAYILAHPNPVLRVELLFQKSSGVEIWVDGVLWDEKSNNPQTTLANVEFRLASTGVPIWWFKAPWARDNTPEQIDPILRLRKTGNSLFVEILTPWSWLETATYPVTIDATVDVQVAAGGDDGRWFSDNGTHYSNSQNQINVGYQDSTYIDANNWYTFLNLTLEGTIDVSYISVYNAFPAGDPSAIDVNIYGDDSDNPSSPNNGAQCEGIVRTSASVNWTPASWDQDVWANTPSINTIVQELVDTYAISGDNVQFTVEEEGSSTDDGWLDTYNESTSLAPKLHIEYSAGVVQEGTATLAGVGTLAANGDTVAAANATLAGVGTLTAAGTNARLGTSTLAGVGGLTAAGSNARLATSTLSGIGTLSAVGLNARLGTATLSGVGSATAVGSRIGAGGATLAGVGSLAAVGTVYGEFFGTATLSGVGTLTAVGTVVAGGEVHEGTATLAGVGSLTAIGENTRFVATTLAGVGSLTAAGSNTRFVTTTLSGVATVQAAGENARFGLVTMAGVGTLVADAQLLANATATLSGVGTLQAIGTLITTYYGTVTLACVGTLQAIGTLLPITPAKTGGDDEKEKPKQYDYQKEYLDMQPVARPDPLFAMRQEQQSVMEANQVVESLRRQNDAEAARRVESMLAREKADKDKADRRRASSLHNLAKAQIAKEAKANKQAEINKVRKKSLKKARAAKKRKAKKK